MAVSTETAATGTIVAAQSSGWLAGIFAMLAETTSMLDQAPIVGFLAMGVLGAFAGWALAIESGKFDALSGAQQMRSLLRRVGIGVAIGVAVGVWWADQAGVSRGVWMLVAGIVAAAPVDMFRAGIELLTTFLRQRIGGSNGAPPDQDRRP